MHMAASKLITQQKSPSDVSVLPPARRELSPWSLRASTTPERPLAPGTRTLMLSNCCSLMQIKVLLTHMNIAVQEGKSSADGSKE